MQAVRDINGTLPVGINFTILLFSKKTSGYRDCQENENNRRDI